MELRGICQRIATWTPAAKTGMRAVDLDVQEAGIVIMENEEE